MNNNLDSLSKKMESIIRENKYIRSDLKQKIVENIKKEAEKQTESIKNNDFIYPKSTGNYITIDSDDFIPRFGSGRNPFREDDKERRDTASEKEFKFVDPCRSVDSDTADFLHSIKNIK